MALTLFQITIFFTYSYAKKRHWQAIERQEEEIFRLFPLYLLTTEQGSWPSMPLWCQLPLGRSLCQLWTGGVVPEPQ